MEELGPRQLVSFETQSITQADNRAYAPLTLHWSTVGGLWTNPVSRRGEAAGLTHVRLSRASLVSLRRLDRSRQDGQRLLEMTMQYMNVFNRGCESLARVGLFGEPVC